MHYHGQGDDADESLTCGETPHVEVNAASERPLSTFTWAVAILRVPTSGFAGPQEAAKRLV